MAGTLQRQSEQAAAARTTAPATVDESMQQIIERQQEAIRRALPAGMDETRFARVLITTVKQTPALLKCRPASLLGAAMEAAALGLEPGPLAEAYLVPYGTDVTFIPSAAGLIKLAVKSGFVTKVVARTVYEGDEFDYAYGLDEHLVHKPTGDDEAKPTHHYAIAWLASGETQFVVMTQAAIDKHRKKFAKSEKAWRENPEPMARKTVLKQLMKHVPKSAELVRAMTNDEKAVNLEPSGKTVAVDLGAIHHEAIDVPADEPTVAHDAIEAGATEATATEVTE